MECKSSPYCKFLNDGGGYVRIGDAEGWTFDDSVTFDIGDCGELSHDSSNSNYQFNVSGEDINYHTLKAQSGTIQRGNCNCNCGSNEVCSNCSHR